MFKKLFYLFIFPKYKPTNEVISNFGWFYGKNISPTNPTYIWAMVHLAMFYFLFFYFIHLGFYIICAFYFSKNISQKMYHFYSEVWFLSYIPAQILKIEKWIYSKKRTKTTLIYLFNLYPYYYLIHNNKIKYIQTSILYYFFSYIDIIFYFYKKFYNICIYIYNRYYKIKYKILKKIIYSSWVIVLFLLSYINSYIFILILNLIFLQALIVYIYYKIIQIIKFIIIINCNFIKNIIYYIYNKIQEKTSNKNNKNKRILNKQYKSYKPTLKNLNTNNTTQYKSYKLKNIDYQSKIIKIIIMLILKIKIYYRLEIYFGYKISLNYSNPTNILKKKIIIYKICDNNIDNFKAYNKLLQKKINYSYITLILDKSFKYSSLGFIRVINDLIITNINLSNKAVIDYLIKKRSRIKFIDNIDKLIKKISFYKKKNKKYIKYLNKRHIILKFIIDYNLSTIDSRLYRFFLFLIKIKHQLIYSKKYKIFSIYTQINNLKYKIKYLLGLLNKLSTNIDIFIEKYISSIIGLILKSIILNLYRYIVYLRSKLNECKNKNNQVTSKYKALITYLIFLLKNNISIKIVNIIEVIFIKHKNNSIKVLLKKNDEYNNFVLTTNKILIWNFLIKKNYFYSIKFNSKQLDLFSLIKIKIKYITNQTIKAYIHLNLFFFHFWSNILKINNINWNYYIYLKEKNYINIINKTYYIITVLYIYQNNFFFLKRYIKLLTLIVFCRLEKNYILEYLEKLLLKNHYYSLLYFYIKIKIKNWIIQKKNYYKCLILNIIISIMHNFNTYIKVIKNKNNKKLLILLYLKNIFKKIINEFLIIFYNKCKCIKILKKISYNTITIKYMTDSIKLNYLLKIEYTFYVLYKNIKLFIYTDKVEFILIFIEIILVSFNFTIFYLSFCESLIYKIFLNLKRLFLKKKNLLNYKFNKLLFIRLNYKIFYTTIKQPYTILYSHIYKTIIKLISSKIYNTYNIILDCIRGLVSTESPLNSILFFLELILCNIQFFVFFFYKFIYFYINPQRKFIRIWWIKFFFKNIIVNLFKYDLWTHHIYNMIIKYKTIKFYMKLPIIYLVDRIEYNIVIQKKTYMNIKLKKYFKPKYPKKLYIKCRTSVLKLADLKYIEPLHIFWKNYLEFIQISEIKVIFDIDKKNLKLFFISLIFLNDWVGLFIVRALIDSISFFKILAYTLIRDNKNSIFIMYGGIYQIKSIIIKIINLLLRCITNFELLVKNNQLIKKFIIDTIYNIVSNKDLLLNFKKKKFKLLTYKSDDFKKFNFYFIFIFNFFLLIIFQKILILKNIKRYFLYLMFYPILKIYFLWYEIQICLHYFIWYFLVDKFIYTQNYIINLIYFYLNVKTFKKFVKKKFKFKTIIKYCNFIVKTKLKTIIDKVISYIYIKLFILDIKKVFKKIYFKTSKIKYKYSWKFYLIFYVTKKRLIKPLLLKLYEPIWIIHKHTVYFIFFISYWFTNDFINFYLSLTLSLEVFNCLLNHRYLWIVHYLFFNEFLLQFTIPVFGWYYILSWSYKIIDIQYLGKTFWGVIITPIFIELNKLFYLKLLSLILCHTDSSISTLLFKLNLSSHNYVLFNLYQNFLIITILYHLFYCWLNDGFKHPKNLIKLTRWYFVFYPVYIIILEYIRYKFMYIFNYIWVSMWYHSNIHLILGNLFHNLIDGNIHSRDIRKWLYIICTFFFLNEDIIFFFKIFKYIKITPWYFNYMFDMLMFLITFYAVSLHYKHIFKKDFKKGYKFTLYPTLAYTWPIDRLKIYYLPVIFWVYKACLTIDFHLIILEFLLVNSIVIFLYFETTNFIYPYRTKPWFHKYITEFWPSLINSFHSCKEVIPETQHDYLVMRLKFHLNDKIKIKDYNTNILLKDWVYKVRKHKKLKNKIYFFWEYQTRRIFYFYLYSCYYQLMLRMENMLRELMILGYKDWMEDWFINKYSMSIYNWKIDWWDKHSFFVIKKTIIMRNLRILYKTNVRPILRFSYKHTFLCIRYIISLQLELKYLTIMSNWLKLKKKFNVIKKKSRNFIMWKKLSYRNSIIRYILTRNFKYACLEKDLMRKKLMYMEFIRRDIIKKNFNQLDSDGNKIEIRWPFKLYDQYKKEGWKMFTNPEIDKRVKSAWPRYRFLPERVNFLKVTYINETIDDFIRGRQFILYNTMYRNFEVYMTYKQAMKYKKKVQKLIQSGRKIKLTINISTKKNYSKYDFLKNKT